jgi:hypothetical protein
MKLNKLIDIDLFPNRDILYCGLCVKENRQVFILINFDTKTKRFDGYSVFRPKEITKYRNWTPAEIRKIKTDNRKTFQSALTLDKMNSFYSTLKSLGKGTLISFFTDNLTDEYYVAKITGLTRGTATLKLIDKKGKWTTTKKIKLADINFFSFLTSYEKGLISNVT